MSGSSHGGHQQLVEGMAEAVRGGGDAAGRGRRGVLGDGRGLHQAAVRLAVGEKQHARERIGVPEGLELLHAFLPSGEEVGRAAGAQKREGAADVAALADTAVRDEDDGLVVVGDDRDAVGRQQPVHDLDRAAFRLFQRAPVHRPRAIEDERQVERRPRAALGRIRVGGLDPDQYLHDFPPAGAKSRLSRRDAECSSLVCRRLSHRFLLGRFRSSVAEPVEV